MERNILTNKKVFLVLSVVLTAIIILFLFVVFILKPNENKKNNFAISDFLNEINSTPLFYKDSNVKLFDKFVYKKISDTELIIKIPDNALTDNSLSSFFQKYPEIKSYIANNSRFPKDSYLYLIYSSKLQNFINPNNPYVKIITGNLNGNDYWLLSEGDSWWITFDNHKTVNRIDIKAIADKLNNIVDISDIDNESLLLTTFSQIKGYRFTFLKFVRDDKNQLRLEERGYQKIEVGSYEKPNLNQKAVEPFLSNYSTLFKYSSNQFLGVLQTNSGMKYFDIKVNQNDLNVTSTIIDNLPSNISISDTATVCNIKMQKCYSFDNARKSLLIFKNGKFEKQINVNISLLPLYNIPKYNTLNEINDSLLIDSDNGTLFIKTNDGWKALYVDKV
jgi:hypothetical protein